MRILNISAVLFALFGAPCVAEEFTIKMLSQRGEDFMVFEPAFVAAKPGDTLTFLPTDGGHNVQTIRGMIPDAAEPFHSAIDEEFSITLHKEGVYGLKCLPHYGMGMVMLVQVGAPTNLEAAQTVRPRGKARGRFKALFSQVVQ